MRRVPITPLLFSLLAGCASGTHDGHHAAGPYAGQQSRDIKALSDDEVRGYVEGAGMGFAKAAELNGYPGPMHTLENADALALTGDQRSAVDAVLKRHKAEVRALGAEVLRLERELDRLFAQREASATAVDAKVAEVAAAQGRVRASHLKAHLETTALLTPAQRERYDRLRGY
jgi:Spy/CpxP family protein refolding chaperone